MSHLQGYREGEAPASQQCSVSRGGSKVTSERVALLVLGVLLAAAVIVIYRLSFDNLQTNKSLQTLRDEHDALKRNLTEKHCEVTSCNKTMPEKCPQPPVVTNDSSCPNCAEGWEQHGEKCYYFSIDKLPWNESRSECRRQGGDLVKIESEEEQVFLSRKLSELIVRYDDKFWIGLTDSVKENEWLWVDGSPLENSLTFWSYKEPDNWEGENIDGEDCVRMGERNRPVLNSWFDKDCRVPQNSICAEPARSRQLKCV